MLSYSASANANAVGQQIHDRSYLGSKDGKAIGVVDEDAPEEPHSQDTIEPLYTGTFVGGSEAEEGHAGQFE